MTDLDAQCIQAANEETKRRVAEISHLAIESIDGAVMAWLVVGRSRRVLNEDLFLIELFDNFCMPTMADGQKMPPHAERLLLGAFLHHAEHFIASGRKRMIELAGQMGIGEPPTTERPA